MFTVDNWPQAADAISHAQTCAADDPELAAAAATEQAYLMYGLVLFRVDPAGEDHYAQAALEALDAADRLLEPSSSHRALLEFRRGLIYEKLGQDPVAAVAAYRNADAMAAALDDEWLLSYTRRHLGFHVYRNGGTGARTLLEQSVRLRESCGFIVGLAPALTALARVCDASEAMRLRSEASRLVRAFGGVPAWMNKVPAWPGDPAARLRSAQPGGRDDQA